jgi:virginiamycin B lyase
LPTPSAYPYDIALGSDGALWFTERSAQQIGRVTSSGAITELADPSIASLSGLECPDCASPNFIVPGPDGALWFSSLANNWIDRVTTLGSFSQFVLPFGPGAIAFESDGDLWYTNALPGLGRMSTSGANATFALGPRDREITTFVPDPGDGAWLGSITDIDSRIGRASSLGQFSEWIIPGVDIVGGTIGPDGAVWFTAEGLSGGSPGSLVRVAR